MSVGTLGGANLFAYCGNNPVMLTDDNGHFGTPIQWACAVIGGIAGWFFGDYVARKIGLFPGAWWQWQNAAYWAVRGLVVVGGAVLGYVAGTALLNICRSFLFANPSVAARLPGVALWFLGMGNGGAAITNAIQNIIPNTINHIMQSKHAWNLVCNNAWTSASKIIEHVLRYGSSADYTAGNTIYTAVYNGRTVQVVVRLVDGTLRIVDAWVRT